VVSGSMDSLVGYFAFIDGGILQFDLTEVDTSNVLWPAACLANGQSTPMTCGQLQQYFSSDSTPPTCTGTSDCTCSAQIPTATRKQEGYATTGTQFTVLPSPGSNSGALSTGSYCVSGDQVTLGFASSSTHQMQTLIMTIRPDLGDSIFPYCGDLYESCCAGDTCGGNTLCQGGTCVICGSGGDPCCTGSICLDANTVCRNGTCQ